MEEAHNRSQQSRKPRLLAILLVILLLPLVIVPQAAPNISRTDDRFQTHTWPGIRIAFVKPVFTATAYSSYYTFYGKYYQIPRNQSITKDLNLLNVTVVDGWGWSTQIQQFLNTNAKDQGLIIGKNAAILTEVDVTQGALFDQDGSRRFDTIVLGFTEYVTIQEYNAYQLFVAHGGRLILLDATNFLAEVRYYPQTNHLALVRGHGWVYDGRKVQFGVFHRWREQNRNWVGGNFCCSNKHYDGANLIGDHPISKALGKRFGSRVFTTYAGHEENGLENSTSTTVLAVWHDLQPSPGLTVAAYVHGYGAGTVVHFGAMGSDMISRDPSIQQFLINSIIGPAGSVPDVTMNQNITTVPIIIATVLPKLAPDKPEKISRIRDLWENWPRIARFQP